MLLLVGVCDLSTGSTAGDVKLNGLTLGQTISDPITQMLLITDYVNLVIYSRWDF
jgi:hypothetical protein